jgi:hypothetical protein
MSLTPIIHEPTSLIQVDDQCGALEAWAERCDSVPDLRDATDRLAAIDEYLARTSTEGRARVTAAMRRLEVRIGELLGPADNHGPATVSRDSRLGAGSDDAERQLRSDFRKMARNPDAVEKVIRESDDDNPPSRRKVVKRIDKLAKPDLGGGISHPARYSLELIDLFRQLLTAYSHPRVTVLDPFAGPGGIHDLHPEFETVGIEREPEWANLHPRNRIGNALDLPFDIDSFDAVVTSPTYGNRFADSHNASDPERRRSYTHDLGHDLSPENSGVLHWRTSPAGKEAIGSAEYRAFHERAWDEAVLVLRPGGLFILNICDHVRDGLIQPVAAWHTWCLGRLGLDYVESRSVPTRKLRQGTNGELREQEQVHVFRKPT